MKKTMIMTALIGFIAIGSYAQNESYRCTEKVIHSTPIQVVQDVPTTGDYIYTTDDTELKTVILVPTGNLVPAGVPEGAPLESCAKFTQNNLEVTDCPGVTFKSDGTNVYEYGTDGVYLGYYPADQNTYPKVRDDNMTCVKIAPEAAPQTAVHKWTIPANANGQEQVQVKVCAPK